MHRYNISGPRFICIILGLCCSVVRSSFATNANLTLVYEWSQIEYDYANETERQAAIDAGYFTPGNSVPIDVDVYYPSDNSTPTIFVAVPRFQTGVPAALGTVSNETRDGNPIITPYPSWEWYTDPAECKTDRILSVFRMMIDECGRLWVLDTGKLSQEMTCSPQLLAFDLNTTELLYRYEIPTSQLENRSTLVTPVVEIRNTSNQCQDTFVYMADCSTYSIIVYDLNNQTSWKATDKTMYPYPNNGTYSIAGETFDLMDGILGMSLAPITGDGKRKLFYHAMSSSTENWVYTSDLRNETRFADDPTSSPEIFKTYSKGRGTQSAAEAISSDGIMFYGLMSSMQIGCFNVTGEYGDKNSTDIVAENPITLQFASGMKVVTDNAGAEQLYVLTSRFQKIMTGTLNSTETNFRIHTAAVSDLVSGKKCSC